MYGSSFVQGVSTSFNRRQLRTNATILRAISIINDTIKQCTNTCTLTRYTTVFASTNRNSRLMTGPFDRNGPPTGDKYHAQTYLWESLSSPYSMLSHVIFCSINRTINTDCSNLIDILSILVYLEA